MSETESKEGLILIADDDPDIREIVSFRLQAAGYETLQASSGDEALRIARETPPSLCILDVMMPKVNGFEVLRELRGDPSTEGMPVLMLTASVQDTDVARGFEVGADDYLRKPFSNADLLEHVSALIDRNG